MMDPRALVYVYERRETEDEYAVQQNRRRNKLRARYERRYGVVLPRWEEYYKNLTAGTVELRDDWGLSFSR